MSCDCFVFVEERDEFRMWQGLVGPYYTPHLSAEGVLSWTNTGNLPNPAPVGISGPPGSGVELRGPVASVADLPATAPSGELWLVGAASPYDGWFYNGASWEDLGQIAIGPAGPQGERGPQGPVGPRGPAVPLSSATPLMDGTASAGSGTSAARGDHRHPTDTSRVAKSGDTMTGMLRVGGPSGTSDGTIQVVGGNKGANPTTGIKYSASLALADGNANLFGFFRSYQDSNGRMGVTIYGLNAGSSASNYIRLLYNGSTPVVEVASAVAWRTALSLGNAALDNIVPVTHGGTGQTGVTETSVASEIFASLQNLPITIDSATLVQWGKVVQLRLQMTAKQAISAGTKLVTVKSTLKPKVPTAIVEISGKNTGYISFSTGDIVLNEALTDGVVRGLLATWIIP